MAPEVTGVGRDVGLGPNRMDAGKKSPADNALKTKRIMNRALNGGAAAVNLLTFINGNKQFLSIDEGYLENFSGGLSKLATGIARGLILAIDVFEKKNPFAFAGYFLEMPIALFTSDENLWLMRGFSQGLGQFQGVLDRLVVNDTNDNPQYVSQIHTNPAGVEELKEKRIFVSDLMDGASWRDNFKISMQEFSKVASSLVKEPSRIKNMSHGLFVASIVQMIGTLVSFTGLHKLSAFIRDASGLGVDLSFITDKKSPESIYKGSEDKLHKGINFDSTLVWAGFTWIGAAILDFAKNFEIISERIPNLTNLSLVSDLAAALLYTEENLNIQSHNHIRLAPNEKEKLSAMRNEIYSLSA